jgi:hypothetical protein
MNTNQPNPAVSRGFLFAAFAAVSFWGAGGKAAKNKKTAAKGDSKKRGQKISRLCRKKKKFFSRFSFHFYDFAVCFYLFCFRFSFDFS